MPNHCHNKLWLDGDNDQIASFVEQVNNNLDDDDNPQILETFYPCPTQLKETVASFGHAKNEEHEALMNKNREEFGHTDWYSWCIDKWGTKWGDYDTMLEVTDNGAWMYQFTSAWSPPTAGIEHISTLFPDITFVHYYSEEGMGFYGLTIYKNGEMVDDCREYEKLDGYVEACNDDRYDEAFQLVHDASVLMLIEYGYGHLIDELPASPQGF